ncbi:MAG TPA: hypothetical protein VGT99_05680, partial [Gammaproteobacteria bacterium]|nr:hypothetical protein [Gammaproteobacteria bacterium]
QGMWLADTDHLGNPPFELTNQVLDGTGVVLDDWTLHPTTHLATNVQPQLVVYGVAGHLYKANLHSISPVQQFSSGGYAQLCSLTPLDERPYAAARAFVQAVVEPTGSTNTCASGVGTQTWLIPANADSSVAPTIEPANWTVLGAFTDPIDSAFVRWIVWTGNEVDAYKANFGAHSTLLVGPPAGPAPALIGRVDGNALLLAPSDSGGVHTDVLYHASMTGSGLIASYSYADGAPCAIGMTTVGTASSSIADVGSGVLAYTEPTNTGYAMYTVPLGGGTPTQVYADASGNECGSIAGDSVSAGHVGLDEVDLPSGFQHVISVNEAGPVSQTPVFLAGGANLFAYIRYTINGHFWIPMQTLNTNPPQYSTLVADGDGTVVQDYTNARMGDDIWGGYDSSGRTPSVQRDVVYLFSPNAPRCTGGTLAAIDPVAFTSINVSGVPADACSALAYGWQPASVGYVQEGTGSRPVEIDPVGGRMYSLLGPDATGFFQNIAILSGYPFY